MADTTGGGTSNVLGVSDVIASGKATPTLAEVGGAGSPGRKSREETLADMRAFKATLAKGGSDKPAAAEPAAPAAKLPAVEADDGDADPAEAVEAKPDEVAAEADDDAIDENDPVIAQRLARIKKAESRSREQIAKLQSETKEKEKRSRSEFDSDVTRKLSEFRQRESDLAAREAKIERARVDPVGFYKALGADEKEFEKIAEQFYRSSEAAAADPKNKAIVEQMRRENEQKSEVEQLKAKVASWEAKEAQKVESEKRSSEEKQFLDGVAKAAAESSSAALADDDPSHVVAKAMALDPEETREEIKKLAYKMMASDGVSPDSDDVIVEYSKQKSAQLKKLGIDSTEWARGTKKSAAKDLQLAPKSPAKTLSANGATATRSKLNPDKPEDRESMLREIARMRNSSSAA